MQIKPGSLSFIPSNNFIIESNEQAQHEDDETNALTSICLLSQFLVSLS